MTGSTRVDDVRPSEIGEPVYDHARHVMARVARTFDLASRFLPPDLRRDVRRLYLVLRTLDDLVDEGDPDAEAELDRVERWAAGAPPDGGLAAILDDLAGRHPRMPRDAVSDFCAGMRADLVGPAHATEGDLAHYCYQVAGTVGRLMVALLGARPGFEAEADLGARTLGAAMQRTNVLRDLAADARLGRVYLPADALVAAGLDPAEGRALLGDPPRLPVETRIALLRPQIERADADYAVGMAGIEHLARGRRSIATAGLLYREVLRQIERDDFGGSGRRVVVPRARKAILVLRASLTST